MMPTMGTKKGKNASAVVKMSLDSIMVPPGLPGRRAARPGVSVLVGGLAFEQAGAGADHPAGEPLAEDEGQGDGEQGHHPGDNGERVADDGRHIEQGAGRRGHDESFPRCGRVG
jgi:hypothetical protein